MARIPGQIHNIGFTKDVYHLCDHLDLQDIVD